MREEWRPAPGYEAVYSVSSPGRVRRDVDGRATYAGRIMSLIAHRSGSASRDSVPYLQVALCVKGRKRLVSVHQLVLWAFVGPPQPGQEPNHLNGLPNDNRPENLEWTDHAGNINHARDVLHRQFGAKGEANVRAKISEADVVAIRLLRSEGVPLSRIAARLNISRTTVNEVVYGRNWNHVAQGRDARMRFDTKGVRNPSAKLDEAAVLAIRALAASGTPKRALARRFRVTSTQIRAIVLRRVWTHL